MQSSESKEENSDLEKIFAIMLVLGIYLNYGSCSSVMSAVGGECPANPFGLVDGFCTGAEIVPEERFCVPKKDVPFSKFSIKEFGGYCFGYFLALVFSFGLYVYLVPFVDIISNLTHLGGIHVGTAVIVGSHIFKWICEWHTGRKWS